MSSSSLGHSADATRRSSCTRETQKRWRVSQKHLVASLQFYRAAVSSKASRCERESEERKRKCPFHCHSDISHRSSELWLTGVIKGVLTVKGHNISAKTTVSVDYNIPNRLIVQSGETSTSRRLEKSIGEAQTHTRTYTKISQILWRIQFSRQLLYKDSHAGTCGVRSIKSPHILPSRWKTISSNVPFNLK